MGNSEKKILDEAANLGSKDVLELCEQGVSCADDHVDSVPEETLTATVSICSNRSIRKACSATSSSSSQATSVTNSIPKRTLCTHCVSTVHLQVRNEETHEQKTHIVDESAERRNASCA